MNILFVAGIQMKMNPGMHFTKLSNLVIHFFTSNPKDLLQKKPQFLSLYIYTVGDENEFQNLLMTNLSINATDPNGHSPLLLAARSGKNDCLETAQF